VIFIECTLLEKRDEDKAIERGHVHWEQLKPFVKELQTVKFVLMHWSRRYSDNELIQFFVKQREQEKETSGGSTFQNLVLWLDSGVLELKNYS